MSKTITIDGIDYVPKGTEQKGGLLKAPTKKGMKYVICRTYSAGVFAGYLEKRTGQEVVLRNARRLWWCWDESESLSELSVRGVSKPENCEFPAEVDRVELMQAIEILDCSEEAQKSIASVKEWTSF